jgi:hypothetical protein
MNMTAVAKLAAGIAAFVLVACAGTGSVRIEALSFGLYAEWKVNPEPEPDKERIYSVTGSALDSQRGEKYKAVFRDKEGNQLAEHEGEIPESGPLEIPAPEKAHSVDWATGEDIENLDLSLPPLTLRADPMGAFRVFRSTQPGSEGSVVEFGFTLFASDLDAALDRAHDVASSSLSAVKPADLRVHFFIEATPKETEVELVSITEAPAASLWVDVNRVVSSGESVDLSQNGWCARGTAVPIESFEVPLTPGESVTNHARVVHGPVDVVLDVETSL